MQIQIVKDQIKLAEIENIASHQFGDLVKFVVDVEDRIIAIGGDLHADEEALLIQLGSKQENLWGINYYPTKNGHEAIEFDSMINIRPSQDNRSRGVENTEIQKKIIEIVDSIVKS